MLRRAVDIAKSAIRSQSVAVNAVVAVDALWSRNPEAPRGSAALELAVLKLLPVKTCCRTAIRYASEAVRTGEEAYLDHARAAAAEAFRTAAQAVVHSCAAERALRED